MRRGKQLLGILLTLLLLTGMMPAMRVYAAGKITIEISTSTVAVGETVKVTARAVDDGGKLVTADIKFSFDKSKFKLAGGTETASGTTANITLEAIAAGSASVSASGSSSGLGEMTSAGVRLTVNEAGKGAAGQSADNSLKSLSISSGSLSPAFAYNVTSYTADVPADVTSIDVDAQPSNGGASIESITGNTDLKEGNNTVTITVKAENGTTAVYKIEVNRGGAVGSAEPPAPEQPEGNQAGPEGITIDGHGFQLSPTVPEEAVPEDFTRTQVTCQGQQVEGLTFNNGTLTLVYLTTPEKEVKNTLAVYGEADGSFYPFRRLAVGNGYAILLNPPADPELSGDYNLGAVTIGEYANIPAYGTESEFCLVYGMSKAGYTGWYRYDSAEGTLQRWTSAEEETGEDTIDTGMKSLQNAYDKLDAKYTKEKSFSRKMIAGLIFLAAVLLVVIVNLLLRDKRSGEDPEEDEDEFEFESEIMEEAENSEHKRGLSRRNTKKSGRKPELSVPDSDNIGEQPEPSLQKPEKPKRAPQKPEEAWQHTENTGSKPETEDHKPEKTEHKPEHRGRKPEDGQKHPSPQKEKKPEELRNNILDQPLTPDENDEFEVIDLDDL